ncbi:MAG: dipeptidyl carboxypeptidase II, partial [Chania sp.]
MRLTTLVLSIGLALSAQVQAEESKLPSDNAAVPSGQMKETNMTEKQAENPFFSASILPFEAPRFDVINTSDYAPAIAAGIQHKLEEIEKIANNPAAPTFDNTLVALEKAGALLARTINVFSAMTAANTSDALQKLDEETSPKLAALNDAIMLNSKLFARIHTIYEQRDALKLDTESRRLLEVTHQNYLLAGANLSDVNKNQLKALNQEAATLSTQFTNKLLAAGKNGALAVTDKAWLAGLTEGELAAAAQAASERKL